MNFRVASVSFLSSAGLCSSIRYAHSKDARISFADTGLGMAKFRPLNSMCFWKNLSLYEEMFSIYSSTRVAFNNSRDSSLLGLLKET